MSLDDFDVQMNTWTRRLRTDVWKAPPAYLFHYTSGAALHEILAENALRGGTIAFMNDRSEFRYGSDLFRSVIREFISRETAPAVRRWLDMCVAEEHRWGDRAYFTSFCQKGDLLSQWRGYGGDGSRYCLKVKTSGLVTSEGFGSPLRPVTYSAKRQQTLLRELLALYVDAVRPMADSWQAETAADAARSITLSATATLMTFKNPSFSEEREWRSVVYVTDFEPMDRARFIPVRGVMKPFREIFRGSTENDRLPLVEVIAGTSQPAMWSIRSAELMLRKYGYAGVSVAASNVPIFS